MKVLITGGAGYIGCVTARELKRQGHQAIVFDHFHSHQPAKLGDLPYVEGDLRNPSEISSALAKTQPDLVMHLAAYIQMGESVRDPRKYYDNNVLGSKNLLEAMLGAGIDKMVFASSAGVYGNPVHIPIVEDDPKAPTNPYGETKLAFERLLQWYDRAYNFRSISIRFFNAAGAALDGQLGEDHHDESHLIPNLITSQLQGKPFVLYGTDYPTPDGTCIRDYIHVQDLAEAFIRAGDRLLAGAVTTAYNAGTGKGYSNQEVISMVEKVSTQPVQIEIQPRRPGDANILIADVSRIMAELKWAPQHSDLESIVRTAYAFHLQNR